MLGGYDALFRHEGTAGGGCWRRRRYRLRRRDGPTVDSQADIATVFDRIKFRGIILATRKDGVVTPLNIGMIGSINAEQLSATSDKTRDALVRRNAMGKHPGGSAYASEAVVLTPEDGDLAIDLRGEIASALSLCVGTQTQKSS